MSDEGQRLIAHTQLVRAERQIERAVYAALDEHQQFALNSLTAAAPPDPFKRDSWATTVARLVRPVFENVLSGFTDRVLKALNLGDREPQARANIDYEARVGDFIARIESLGHLTAQGVFEEIQQGMAKGETNTQITRRIEDRFGVAKNDASRIVRTETHGAAEGAKFDAAVVAQRSGFRMTKRWLTIFDGKARRTHVRAMGQEVDLHANFTVGLGSGPRPGAIGLPEEDIRCRCSAGYRRLQDDEPMPAAQTEAQRDENERRHKNQIEENNNRAA